MKPRPITDEDAAMWAGSTKIIMKAPPSMDDCSDAEAIRDGDKIRTAWVSDDRDDVPFEGTVWLTFWGGMPPTDMWMTT